MLEVLTYTLAILGFSPSCGEGGRVTGAGDSKSSHGAPPESNLDRGPRRPRKMKVAMSTASNSAHATKTSIRPAPPTPASSGACAGPVTFPVAVGLTPSLPTPLLVVLLRMPVGNTSLNDVGAERMNGVEDISGPYRLWEAREVGSRTHAFAYIVVVFVCAAFEDARTSPS